jgi:hypothetical protein
MIKVLIFLIETIPSFPFGLPLKIKFLKNPGADAFNGYLPYYYCQIYHLKHNTFL